MPRHAAHVTGYRHLYQTVRAPEDLLNPMYNDYFIAGALNCQEIADAMRTLDRQLKAARWRAQRQAHCASSGGSQAKGTG